MNKGTDMNTIKRIFACHTALWLAAILIALLAAPLVAQVAPRVQASSATQPLHDAAQTPDGLSDGEWQQILGQIRQAAYRTTAADQPNHYRASNPAQGWALNFSPVGLRVQPQTGDWTWGLQLQRVGYLGAMQTLTTARLQSDETTVRLPWTPWLVEE
jgi:hypothetical protein